MSKENIVIDGKGSHLRVDTSNLKSKEDCFIAINEILTVIRLEFPTYPVGDENIDTYEYLGNVKLCVAIWNDTYENLVSELWGHAKLNDLKTPIQDFDELILAKAEEADINKSDQTDDSEIEKDLITLFGGGDINLHGDGPKREGGEYV